MSLLPQHESCSNIELIGFTDQGGRGDGIQVMVERGYAYVGNRLSKGVTVTDVRNPRNPKPIGVLPVHGNTWSIHLQTYQNYLLVVEEFDFKLVMSQKEYYAASISGHLSNRFGVRGKDFTAGMRVYDITDPAHPKAIGFMEVEGLGLHRIWWVGGRYAYASALLDGYKDHILIVIDMNDPAKPLEVGRWWIPGMWVAGGETANWTSRYALHHAVVENDVAYACWRDGGLTILDVSQPSSPRLIAHRNWSPPYGGGTHSALPLHDRDLLIVADEAVHDIDQEQLKRTWVFDIREKNNPISISTFPSPNNNDYVAKGGHFGPHNLHENRPGSFQSSTKIIATYQNAGVRIFDITDPYRPEETAYFVPPTPTKWAEPRRGLTKALHTGDVFVDKNGLIYISDYDAGLYILQWNGQ